MRVMFVCHGNICRSPMAEFLFRDMVRKAHLADRFVIASSGTSAEELGNPVHPGAQRKLAALGISTRGKYALQLSRQDYAKYDYLIGMTARNVQNMRRILGSDPDHKLHRLLDFTPRPRDIADPWYTGDFDMAYQDIAQGCRALLAHLQAEGAL